MSVNYALKLAYSGQGFSGFQRQANAPSVQQTFEEIWRRRFDEVVTATGASRTDAGVNARGQVVMVRSKRTLPPERVARALNDALPRTLSVWGARVVDEAFHARYGARAKRYTYRIATGPAPDPFRATTHLFRPGTLDLPLMNEALARMMGERDMRALMDQGSPSKRYVRRLMKASAEAQGDEVTVTLIGDGFLYHMVRIAVGTALAVAQGTLSLATLERHLIARERVGLGPTLPPEGLSLDRVYYDTELFGGDAWSHALAEATVRP